MKLEKITERDNAGQKIVVKKHLLNIIIYKAGVNIKDRIMLIQIQDLHVFVEQIVNALILLLLQKNVTEK